MYNSRLQSSVFGVRCLIGRCSRRLPSIRFLKLYVKKLPLNRCTLKNSLNSTATTPRTGITSRRLSEDSCCYMARGLARCIDRASSNRMPTKNFVNRVLEVPLTSVGESLKLLWKSRKTLAEVQKRVKCFSRPDYLIFKTALNKNSHQ